MKRMIEELQKKQNELHEKKKANMKQRHEQDKEYLENRHRLEMMREELRAELNETVARLQHELRMIELGRQAARAANYDCLATTYQSYINGASELSKALMSVDPHSREFSALMDLISTLTEDAKNVLAMAARFNPSRTPGHKATMREEMTDEGEF